MRIDSDERSNLIHDRLLSVRRWHCETLPATSAATDDIVECESTTTVDERGDERTVEYSGKRTVCGNVSARNANASVGERPPSEGLCTTRGRLYFNRFISVMTIQAWGMSMSLSKPTSLLPAGFFVARTPLLSALKYSGIAPELALEDPIVRDAIAQASPSLVAEATLPGRNLEKARPAIARYLARMRGRPTPFSLMAGYTHGYLSSRDSLLELGSLETVQRIVRIDSECIAGIVRLRLYDASNRDYVRWCTRCDLTVLEDVVRLTNRDPHDRNGLTFIDLERTAPLDAALKAARNPATITEIAAALSPFAATTQQARHYIEALINTGVFLPDTYPSLAGDDELSFIETIAPDLVTSARLLRTTPLSKPMDDELARLREHISHARGDDSADDLIFDIVKPLSSGGLGDDLVDELRYIITVLQRVALPSTDLRIREFLRIFSERYEGRSVRLVEALDPFRGYDFPVEPVFALPDKDLVDRTIAIFERACRQGATEITLSENELPSRTLWYPRSVLSLVFRLAREPLSVYEPRLEGAPGTVFFARATSFLSTLRTEVRDFLAERLASSTEEDAVEVTPFLTGKFASFAQFPKLLNRELTLQGAAVDRATNVDLNEVIVSVIDGQFVLHSEVTGRRVVPYVTSAANLNRRDNTSAGRFLGALSREGRAMGGWTWHGLRQPEFAPRVRYRTHVLAPAQWNLSPQWTSRLLAAKTRAAQIDAVAYVRRELTLPRFVVFREGHDHALPIDLDDQWSVSGWLDIAKAHMRLTEDFPVARSAVRGPDGPYHHELVLPFAVSVPEQLHDQRPHRVGGLATPPFDRVIPGGHVLYVRFDGDTNELLAILRTIHTNVLAQSPSHHISHWFFVPYSDPSPHIRLRVFGTPSVLSTSILYAIRRLLEPLVQQRVLARVSVETYDRETYRYGGPVGMELCEKLFHVSSEFALRFHERVGATGSDATEFVVPWVQSLKATLASAALSPGRERNVVAHTIGKFSRSRPVTENGEPLTRFRPILSPRQRAGSLFRRTQRLLRQDQEAVVPFSDQLSRRLGDLMTALRTEVEAGTVQCSIDDLLANLLHLHSIRLITTWSQDPQLEEVGYHLLGRVLLMDESRNRGSVVIGQERSETSPND